MEDEPVDFSSDPEIEPGCFPTCPLCDNEIMYADPACEITAHGSRALAHVFCVAVRRRDLWI